MQKEFLETLNSDAPRRQQDRHRKNAHVANDFALGYTYQDVLDADHEGIGFHSRPCLVRTDALLQIYSQDSPSTSSLNRRPPLPLF